MDAFSAAIALFSGRGVGLVVISLVDDGVLLVVRSFSYARTMQAGLHRRLHKAEKALRALTPQRGRGKRQIKDEESLYAAMKRIEKKYRIKGLFNIDHEKEVTERKIRAYKGKPARVERKVRFQLSLRRNQAAIAAAEFKAGRQTAVSSSSNRSTAPLHKPHLPFG